MARRQLRTRRLLVFNRLANEYNEKHKDVMHRAGEAIVKKHESSSADKLKSDRPAPWRKASAIERKSHEWEEWRKMMVEIRMKRQEDVVQGIHREEREDSPDDAEIADPNSEPPKYVDLKSIRRGIERPAKSFVTSAPTAKQPNTNLEASYNAAGHLVISYGQNIPYSYLGYKIQAILDGTKTASSFAINNSKIQPIFVVADLPPIDKLSDSNLEALEHDDIEWTMEEVIAARSLMELGEDKENNDWAGMLAPVSTNNANNSPDVMENDDDEHNGLYDAD